jgi:hypothetical protein
MQGEEVSLLMFATFFLSSPPFFMDEMDGFGNGDGESMVVV